MSRPLLSSTSGPAGMTFADAFDALAATSDGTLCTLIVMEEDRDKLVAAAGRGDERALMLVKAMVGCIEALRGAPPAQCGCCDRAMVLTDLAGCGVITTAMEGAGNMLVLNICLACGPNRRAALAGVASALARLRPECRQLSVHGTAGRA